ncbi:uncharacterized protein MELLADRAFT_91141 [Melampsora larici-populina 98AG31]|uniref:Uncharacterized protein n=1 Tax=Melampsora larici-populina (strain 98AG31 / pathotype 3-4-7) TaxID=747676 RepID=F4SEG9_MELLP|nr:uncharacterized protein MELLADRAFT_91141 [Melampsora larici-populina 98AG31]EGF96958.1 hypothetical protein MELLADRAFT_91141 [Melampsora larici-populina 98AG31]
MANNKKSTNTENFREMMKRSSSRLRGGSVPPPDSDPVVPQAVARNLRGKSRGRGGRTAASPGRSDAQVDRPADTTPVVTLTAPKDTNDALAPPAPDLDITSSEVNGNKRSGTSVLHSGGLISRDEVNNEPHSMFDVIPHSDATYCEASVRVYMSKLLNKSRPPLLLPARSPTRRNTTSAIGKSPPRGFHSWLKANGLTVVNDSGVLTSATQNVSSALAHKEKASAPTHATSKTPTQAIVDKSTTVVQKEKTWVDLTKDDVVKKKKVEVGEAGIQTSGLVGLSKYFEDKMEAMKGYVPLSIFNVMWLKQALIHQSNGVTTKKNKDESRYNGLPVPDEWRMTFGEWVTAFDLFVAYLRYYGHGTTADKFVIHKQNVFAIRAERMSWPMAFRYNQAVRTSVMTFRNPDGKLANPAIRDETIERDARLETERLGDFQPRFADENPYAEDWPKRLESWEQPCFYLILTPRRSFGQTEC